MNKKKTEQRKQKPRALISVSDKTGVIEFGRALLDLGFEIVSSGGTAMKLRYADVPCLEVERVTGFPEILDGRVKTLHPRIHAGILARQTAEHQQELAAKRIRRFQIVCVNLYPFEQTVANQNATHEEVIEKIDIGGVALLRAAAKNFDEGLVVICDPADYNRVIEALRDQGEVDEGLRLELAQKAFERTAVYDAAICQYLAKQQGSEVVVIPLKFARQLAYAENRNQNPAHLFSSDSNDPLALHQFKVVSGDPSYISIADGSQILEVLCVLAEAFRQWKGKVPFIVIAGKHGNPCGAAIDWNNPAVAIKKALLGDPLAVMGGEVITNFAITDELGQLLFATGDEESRFGRKMVGLDIILAPEFSPAAIQLLGKREKRRLLANLALSEPILSPDEWVWRQVRGGWLRQKAPRFILTRDKVQFWASSPLEDDDFETLLVAWAVCWKASSNTVALAKDRMLIALGCGQQDRIACVRLCLERANRAGHDTRESVFASDAFFPYATSPSPNLKEVLESVSRMIAEATFLAPHSDQALERLVQAASDISRVDKREGPELLADAGCIGGVVPADGKNLANVRAFFNMRGLSVAFVDAENRGFAKH